MRQFLKIAVTATCLGACLALVALWVRSYWVCDSLWGRVAGSQTRLESDAGVIGWTGNIEPLFDYLDHWHRFERSPHWDEPRWFFETDKYSDCFFVVFPHWFPALLTAMLAAAPWLKWRFNVRTLLIATAVAAVILGVAVATN